MIFATPRSCFDNIAQQDCLPLPRRA